MAKTKTFNKLLRRIDKLEEKGFQFYISLIDIPEEGQVEVTSQGETTIMDTEDYLDTSADRKIFLGSEESYEKFTSYIEKEEE